jgi:hypothetical protein
MRFVPLDCAEWAQSARPVHRASARPRLLIPREERTPMASHFRPLRVLRHWYACEVPVGQEIAQARAAWQQSGRYPLADGPWGLFVPQSAQRGIVWPGYVVLISETALDAPQLLRVRLTLSGFLGDPPWPIDPLRDLPWSDLTLTASFATPSLRIALRKYPALLHAH